VFLCHGFGAPGDDLAGLAEVYLEQCLSTALRPALVFPAAPLDLADEGMPGGRAWWRLNMARLMQATMTNSFDQLRSEIPAGIDQAREALMEAVRTARHRFGSAPQLVLGGFSQGAMLAVDTALRGLDDPPHGLIIYSGALLCEGLWRPLSSRLASTRIYLSHGTLDPILPIQTGRWLAEMLLEAGCRLNPYYFQGPHTIPMRALHDSMRMFVD
jgi:phospholipase/carboxylesterase